MTTLTVQADDTASAMDEIAQKLGADALILSTTKRDGKVIMRASNEAGLSVTPAARSAVRHDFTTMFDAATRPAAGHQRGTDSRIPDMHISERRLKCPAEAESRSNSHISSAVASPNAQQAMMQALTVMAEKIEQLEEKLSGLVVTNHGGLNDELRDSTPVQLMRAGFSQQAVTGLRTAYAGIGYEAGVTSFLDMLAEDLSLHNPEELLKKRLIFVIGPTGAGRTTLAAKLAASLKETHKSREVALASMSASQHEPDSRLRSLARLLNIPVSHITSDIPDQDFDRMTDFDMMVVDVTLAPAEAVRRLESLYSYLGPAQASVVMAVPGGSSAKMIDVTMQNFRPLSPIVALTKLDECETTPAEFSALHNSGAKIGMLSGTRSVVGAVAFASQTIIAQYLKENFSLNVA